MARDRFTGQIAGVGSSSGVRVVVGRWTASPFGEFADVMVADRDGTRLLLAPSEEVARYVSDTYDFDHVITGPVEVAGDARRWLVKAPQLELAITLGARTGTGRLLHALPRALATSPAFATVTDPVARVVMRGVHTRGTTKGGRHEYYGATDLQAVVSLTGTWRGRPLGHLAPVKPEPRFGFGSTPRRPSVTTLVTTVRH